MSGFKIRREDTVKVITGKDRGKSGRVLRVYPERAKLLVEGVNFVKKHARKTRQDDQGGIVQKESPLHMSNVMLVCKNCNAPARIGYDLMKDGSKVRVCKKCKDIIG